MEQNEIQVLVEKSRRKDASAFALLVAEYQAFVFRLSFRLLCDEEEARDMVQETFLRVWLSLDKYRPEFRFSTWLYRVACNICYDRLRALQHSPAGALSDITFAELPVCSDDNIEATLVNRELKAHILYFMQQLTLSKSLYLHCGISRSWKSRKLRRSPDLHLSRSRPISILHEKVSVRS